MYFKLSTRKIRHHYDEDPATVRSINHQRLKSVSARLASTIAARNIISVIQRREVVHRLDIGDSSLGDEGCVQLFNFLDSPAGQRCKNSLTELYLTKNDIGAKGLLAVSKFIKDNDVLRELCLSGNPLSINVDVIAQFTTALNSSRLCTLQLIHNGTLSDTFIRAFLPRLNTRYLRQLGLSAINITRAVVPTIIEYVTSPRCRLDRLQCNANSLTLPGAREIISAIERENYSLFRVNLDDLHIDEYDGDGEERTLAWQEGWRILNNAAQRNLTSKIRVKKQAVSLLLYSRALFLRSSMRDIHGGAPDFTSVSTLNRLSASIESNIISAPSMFFQLPEEIQQEIIALLAPDLSHRQRMRVVAFAADFRTLPQLDEPHLEAENTAHLPEFMRAGLSRKADTTTDIPYEGSWKPPAWWECACPEGDRRNCRTLHRWERERRDVWLTRVGCDVWEPEFTLRDADL
ncbi:hypothetical protein DEU56DRAFT_358086 [Suillus clintonianus]|uniref:uncharacterized protein n=1 Tax=Suillus clintonianus TaxID=1904413 RepID=UPI001B883EF8|nr:uncharacterized protein DEU56DRAFT_358086 [Suillus clintonianus]KAG2136669.1 hypothetical protein DEU56DRAFT_358086 [Suillus clintonianus]